MWVVKKVTPKQIKTGHNQISSKINVKKKTKRQVS